MERNEILERILQDIKRYLFLQNNNKKKRTAKKKKNSKEYGQFLFLENFQSRLYSKCISKNFGELKTHITNALGFQLTGMLTEVLGKENFYSQISYIMLKRINNYIASRD